MSTEMSTHTIYVNRDASRDVNKDANRDANRDASRDVNRDASRDVNLMPVVILAEISSVIPAYTTPYIACRQSSCSVCHSEHQMSSTGHCSFVVPEKIQHYSVVPRHVHPVISVINIGSSVRRRHPYHVVVVVTSCSSSVYGRFQFRVRRKIWFRSVMLQILHVIQYYCGDVAVTSETFFQRHLCSYYYYLISFICMKS